MSSEPTTPFKGTAVTAMTEVDDTIGGSTSASTPPSTAPAVTGSDTIGKDEPGTPTPAAQHLTGLKAAAPGGPAGAEAALLKLPDMDKRPPH